MIRFKNSLFIFALLISYKTFAYTPSEGKVTAILGPYLYKTNFSGSESGAKSPYLGDIGLIAQGDLNDKGGLEVALFHMNKLYFRQSNGLYIAEKTELIHISLGYKYWMTSYFAMGLAFYSAYSIGVPTIEHNDFPIGQEIDTSARDTTEYGFDISVQSELWSNNRFSVVADGRYSVSVTNKQNENGNHYGVLLGLRYMIQEKYPEKAVKDPNLQRKRMN